MYLYSIFYKFKKEIIEIEYEIYMRNTCLEIVFNWYIVRIIINMKNFGNFDLKNESWRLFDIEGMIITSNYKNVLKINIHR